MPAAPPPPGHVPVGHEMPASGHPLQESVARRRLGAGEAAVVIAAIAALTTLAAMQRPVPAVLTALASAAVILLVPTRLRAVLAAWAAAGYRL